LVPAADRPTCSLEKRPRSVQHAACGASAGATQPAGAQPLSFGG